MQNKRLVNAMKKAGLEVIVTENRCVVNGPENQVTWYIQNERAICVYVRDHNMHDDLMADYHAGFFARTIKRAVECAAENTKAA